MLACSVGGQRFTTGQRQRNTRHAEKSIMSYGCSAWPSNFDPFGLFPEDHDEEVPSDEEDQDVSMSVRRAVLEELAQEPIAVQKRDQAVLDLSLSKRQASNDSSSWLPSTWPQNPLHRSAEVTPPRDQPLPAREPTVRKSPQHPRVARQIAQLKKEASREQPSSARVPHARHHFNNQKPSVAHRLTQKEKEASHRENFESIEVSPSVEKGVLLVTTNKNGTSKLKHTSSYSTTLTGSTESDYSSQGAYSNGADSGNVKQYVYPERTRRRWSVIIILVATVLLLLILALASLAAAGKFDKNEPVPASNGNTQTGNPWNNTGDGTGGTVGSNDDHDTEDPPADSTETDEGSLPPTTTGPEMDNNTSAPTSAPPPTSPPLGTGNANTDKPMTYEPGLLTVNENGLLLSKGLKSRLIAERNRPVQYSNGSYSTELFHRRPDYGACFAVPPDLNENQGGWVYVSNSELGGGNDEPGLSGVGAIYFDKDGNVIEYKMLLTDSTKNCAGGRTPWNTFISCEEARDIGQVWQIDPFDRRPPEQITMGKVGGRYEAFAYDDRDKNSPRFFVTEDLSNGPTIRWTPDDANWDEPWDILTGPGTLEYLLLNPNPADNHSTGTFEWTQNLDLARANAQLYARGTEGIDRKDNLLYFVCKTDRLFYILDLDAMTFVMYPANIGLFEGEPDQVKRMVNDTQDILYFSEQSDGDSAGIHGRNSKGQYFTILEGPAWEDEATTGLSFSPNGLHMYVAFQDPGVVFDIWREDGYPFHGTSLEVHYHNPPIDHLLLRH